MSRLSDSVLPPVRALVGALALSALAACGDGSGGKTTVALPATGAGSLLLNHVNVIDVRTGKVNSDISLLADGGRIVSIAPAGSLAPEAGSVTIEARGKFVVPGYLDMHAHVLGHEDDPGHNLLLMLANGVTGFRQMQGSSDLLAERQSGTLRLIAGGPALLGMPGAVLTPLNAGDPQNAIATIREQQAQGADFIKIGLVAPAVFAVVLSESRQLGIPAVGHVPAGFEMLAAARLGMRSIEHLGPSPGLLVACSSETAALLAQAPGNPSFLWTPPFRIPFADQIVEFLIHKKLVNPAWAAGTADLPRLERALATFSEPRCREAAAIFAASGTWHVPTLIRQRTSRLADDPNYSNDPNLRFESAETVALWKEVTNAFVEEIPESGRALLRRTYDQDLKLVKLLDETGARMLAGSDVTGAGWLMPGFSLHQEFDELEKAGLAPLRVLQMATMNGAEFLNRSDMGTVEAGKVADLVLLEANPLDSVQNLHHIHAVVRAGVYHSRSDLDAILASVASAPAAN